MQNLSDQELDDLFKRAAEKSEGDSAMPDWTDMNNRLDQAERGGFFWQNKGVITGSVLVITVAVLLWWGLELELSGDDVRTIAEQVQHSKDSESEIDNKVQLKSNESDSKTSENKMPETSSGFSEENDDRSLSEDNDEVAFELNPVSNSKPEKIPTVHKARQEIEVAKASANLREKQIDQEKVSSKSQNDFDVVGITEKNNETKIENKEVINEQVVEINAVVSNADRSDLVSTDSVIIEEEPVNKLEETVTDQSKDESDKKEDEPSKSYRGFSIKLAISPDYSTVKSVQPDKMGLNYGLLVEYGFSKNLSVATGLIRANKFYSAHKIEYNGQASDKVDGDCRMWDVPVTLYYTFSPQRTWSLYAGLGVSSYLMSKENYVYYVEGGYGNVYTYEQTVRGKNNEWFSMLNLSVGVNKQLNTRWAIQLEPFYKAPLAGVGEGDVSLASLGAFLNLKYNFSTIK